MTGSTAPIYTRPIVTMAYLPTVTGFDSGAMQKELVKSQHVV
jgi:hypothetical protein